MSPLTHGLNYHSACDNNSIDSVHCVSKNIPIIFDCNLKKDNQILIIFDTSIPHKTGHQMTIQFPPATTPNRSS